MGLLRVGQIQQQMAGLLHKVGTAGVHLERVHYKRDGACGSDQQPDAKARCEVAERQAADVHHAQLGRVRRPRLHDSGDAASSNLVPLAVCVRRQATKRLHAACCHVIAGHVELERCSNGSHAAGLHNRNLAVAMEPNFSQRAARPRDHVCICNVPLQQGHQRRDGARRGQGSAKLIAFRQHGYRVTDPMHHWRIGCMLKCRDDSWDASARHERRRALRPAGEPVERAASSRLHVLGAYVRRHCM